jgi:hypothetical protein
MIGRIRFTDAGQDVVATLDDDGTWACPDRPAVAAWLARAFDPRTDHSPADGRFGARALHEAALLLGGTAELTPQEPDPPGVIY